MGKPEPSSSSQRVFDWVCISQQEPAGVVGDGSNSARVIDRTAVVGQASGEGASSPQNEVGLRSGPGDPSPGPAPLHGGLVGTRRLDESSPSAGDARRPYWPAVVSNPRGHSRGGHSRGDESRSGCPQRRGRQAMPAWAQQYLAGKLHPYRGKPRRGKPCRGKSRRRRSPRRRHRPTEICSFEPPLSCRPVKAFPREPRLAVRRRADFPARYRRTANDAGTSPDSNPRGIEPWKLKPFGPC